MVYLYPESLITKFQMAEKPNTAPPVMKGGTKDFNWQAVKNMNYRDREVYLGYTVKVGFLEKG